MRAHLRVYGAVQGVGFRYFVRQAARAAHLDGWVRNNPDGSVQLEADGPDDAMRQFIHTVRHGPPLARVDRLDSLEPSTAPLPAPFEIRH